MARSKSLPPRVDDSPADPVPAVLDLAPQLWRIKLQYAPTLTVEAGSAEEAWEVYKPLVGLIRSDHTPEITRDGDNGSN